jgi:hypothetical protein
MCGRSLLKIPDAPRVIERSGQQAPAPLHLSELKGRSLIRELGGLRWLRSRAAKFRFG